jgi:hypothetical protein
VTGSRKQGRAGAGQRGATDRVREKVRAHRIVRQDVQAGVVSCWASTCTDGALAGETHGQPKGTCMCATSAGSAAIP